MQGFALKYLLKPNSAWAGLKRAKEEMDHFYL
jgi:hypothetical protein